MQNETPLRLLVKSYANGLLDRQQYLNIRQELLKKLSDQGTVTQKDLQKYLLKYQDSEQPGILSNYSLVDWIIITLGFIAAATLGLFLFG